MDRLWTMFPSITLFTVFTVVAILVYYYFFKFVGRNLPPGPIPLPLIGNLHILGQDLQNSLKDLADKYGKVFRLYIGEKLVVVLSGDAIREALVRKPSDFAGRPSMYFYKIALRDNPPLVLIDYGDHWRIHRRLAHKTIKVYGTNRYEMIIQQEITELCTRLQLKESLGKPARIKIEIGLAIMNVICNQIFGSRFDVGDPEFLEMFQLQAELFRLSTVAARGLVDLFPFLRFVLPVSGDVRQLQITNDRWREILWAVLYLLHFPDIQRKIHAEIDTVIGRRGPVRLDTRKSLPYLEAFICETMRYTSILPLSVPHMTTVNTTIGGYDIPKGTTVIVNIWALHRDPSFWKDPERFHPERFLDADGTFVFPDGGYFLPFGAGPRACMGEVLARCELFLFLANLLQKFTFENPAGVALPPLKHLPGGAVLQPAIEQVMVKTRPVKGYTSTAV